MIRGNLLMIPIGDSFLYVEPIYLQAETSRFPELKRVVVANGNEVSFKIAMEPTFEASLDVVFGRRASTLPGASGIISTPGEPSPPPTAAPGAATTPTGEFDELLNQATSAADAAQREIDKLRSLLEAIRQQQGQ